VTVFIEVKTRTSSSFGLPEESVTPKKQAHLLAAVEAYRQAHPDRSMDWRVDVIAIRRKPGSAAPELTHFENALA
jgi:putative endonuclease